MGRSAYLKMACARILFMYYFGCEKPSRTIQTFLFSFCGQMHLNDDSLISTKNALPCFFNMRLKLDNALSKKKSDCFSICNACVCVRVCVESQK